MTSLFVPTAPFLFCEVHMDILLFACLFIHHHYSCLLPARQLNSKSDIYYTKNTLFMLLKIESWQEDD